MPDDIYQINPSSTHNDADILSINGYCIELLKKYVQDQDLPDFSGLFDPCDGDCLEGIVLSGGGSGFPDGDFVITD